MTTACGNDESSINGIDQAEADSESSTTEQEPDMDGSETGMSEGDGDGDQGVQPGCGNGIVEPELSEECDLGEDNDDEGACTSACTLAVCGDGLVQAGVEDCDDGNDDETDACTSVCAQPSCEDGLVSGEESDLDCGGACPGCALGSGCVEGSDCALATCVEGICTLPRSCAELNEATPGLSDGLYSIDPDGEGGHQPYEVWCDMSLEGGGWTRVMTHAGAHAQEINWFYTSAPAYYQARVTTGAPDEASEDHWSYAAHDLAIEGEVMLARATRPGVGVVRALHMGQRGQSLQELIAAGPDQMPVGVWFGGQAYGAQRQLQVKLSGSDVEALFPDFELSPNTHQFYVNLGAHDSGGETHWWHMSHGALLQIGGTNGLDQGDPCGQLPSYSVFTIGLHPSLAEGCVATSEGESWHLYVR